jgi:CRISPR-associated endonuclease/helicase Cas3
LIYRNDAKFFLNFIRENIKGQIEEKQLFQIQRAFFESISKNLEIGSYPEGSMNLIQEINRAQFENVGKFQLINNKIYGTQYQFFIPESDDDFRFEELTNLIAETKQSDYAFYRNQKIKIEIKLKSISNRIVSVRLYNKSEFPPLSNSSEICSIYKLDREYYCDTRGIAISIQNQFL